MKLARGSHVEPLLPVRLAIGFPQPGHQSHPWPEESYRPCGPWYLAQRTGPILKLNGKVIWSLFLSGYPDRPWKRDTLPYSRSRHESATPGLPANSLPWQRVP